MSDNTASPWLIPGINERLTVLHALSGKDYLNMAELAAALNAEFDTKLTRNSIIGRSHRLDLQRDNPTHRPKPRKRSYLRIDAPIGPKQQPRCDDGSLTITQLRDGDCKWALGDINDRPPFQFCGKHSEIGRSYCPEHYGRVYHKPRMTWSEA